MKQRLLDKVRRIGPGKALFAAMVLIVLAALLSFINYYSLQNVTVLGNVHYTEEEIKAEVTKGILGNNTWVVSHTRSSFTPDDMELIDQIDVTMKDHHTLQITVQERQLIGYVQYLDCNLYFDSEGRVMDSVIREEENGTDTADGGSEALTAEAVGKTATSFVAAMKEAPRITGLSFTHAQLHEILPVSDDSVFYTILGIARMINKYDINPDEVNFDENMQITLTYGNLTVNLGKDELIEEKLTRMAAILPSIEGKSGVLHMEDYTSGTQNIVFSQSVLAAEGIDAKVINIHTIKPLDADLVIKAAQETGKVVTVEEHSVIGGLGAAVMEAIAEEAPCKVSRLGVNDQDGHSGPGAKLLEEYGFTAENIAARAKKMLK